MSATDKLNPAEVPESKEVFITIQITGRPRSVDIIKAALRDEIDATVKFCTTFMGPRKPTVQVHESQVA